MAHVGRYQACTRYTSENPCILCPFIFFLLSVSLLWFSGERNSGLFSSSQVGVEGASVRVLHSPFPLPVVLYLQRLELFDELEEWRLIQAHYSIAVAVKDPVRSGA